MFGNSLCPELVSDCGAMGLCPDTSPWMVFFTRGHPAMAGVESTKRWGLQFEASDELLRGRDWITQKMTPKRANPS